MQCGDKQVALKELARLIRTPGSASNFNVYELKRDPRNPLRDDPQNEGLTRRSRQQRAGFLAG
jgi:hypothetical protein